ncbi:MAG: hypothetical protein ACFFCW_01855 [Candidatus Hodarchaeota archaeon]
MKKTKRKTIKPDTSVPLCPHCLTGLDVVGQWRANVVINCISKIMVHLYCPSCRKVLNTHFDDAPKVILPTGVTN